MPQPQPVSFQTALDIVESLPVAQQEDLVEIIRRRRIEARREELASSLLEARQELDRGEARRGTVEDLMRELSE